MPTREPMTPLDPPMVPFAVVGIAVWAVLGLAAWATGRTGWAQICLAGFLWGFPGLLVMLKHDANRRRRRSSTPERGQPDGT